MRNLFDFFLKYHYWFLFIALEAASLVLLFRYNRYQQSALFSSANRVSGAVHEMSEGITSYFHLRSMNEDLLDRNMALERQIGNLRRELKARGADQATIESLEALPNTGYRLFKAHVIKNSLNQADNYITLDKGSRDGIRPDMGVVDRNGIVGIVYATSPAYSIVLSALNSRSSISCKIARSEYFGYLKWEYGDPRYAYLKDLPRHAEFNLGDTVVTSGYSTVFPEGVMVGTVDDMSDSPDGLSYLLRVKLATDFGKLDDVRVIERAGQAEQKQLERKAAEEKER
ncbi:MAG: rod shape-determining protein MreC [Mediterranea sp.]|jgi:rod shape-determining protein MreC|nr:rod shape-determining protein MreC [Mediterranea sp.]